MRTNALKEEVTIANVEALVYAADYLGMDQAMEILVDFKEFERRLNNNNIERFVLIYLRLWAIQGRYLRDDYISPFFPSYSIEF